AGRGANAAQPVRPGSRLPGPRQGAGKGSQTPKGAASVLLGRRLPGWAEVWRGPAWPDSSAGTVEKRYWEDFHSCTVTALTDCQEGAKDMWDKLRKESKNLNIQGSLFELCGSGNGAAGSLLPALPVLLVSLSAALATWLSF
uniref:Neuritin 1 n=1 Tax=Felis catus TaxID=9685 RepID=A0ABI7XQQ6_FELCA